MEQFEPDLKEIFYPTASERARLSVPGLVYHYTTQEGLFGILRSRTLWASDVRFLNDFSELSYGCDLIMGRLANVVGDGPLLEAYRGVFQRLRSQPFAPHVASFSEVPDDLSQWRAYGDYCLGFNIDLNARLNRARAVVGPVSYDEADHRQVAEKLVNEIILDAQRERVSAAPLPHPMATRFGLSVYQTALFLKSSSFAAEKEWRVLAWGSVPGIVEVGVRHSSAVPTPYVSLPLGAPDGDEGLACLEHVIVGPRNHQALTHLGVTRELHRLKLSAKAYSSAITYRSW